MRRNVVNLNRFRKKKLREERAKQAEVNRVKHGRTAAEKKSERMERERAARAVDGARLTPETSARTLAWYDAHARSFEEGTRDHDVSQNYAALLDAIEGAPPFSILDLGCGPGRDLAYFRSLGHEAIGLDGSRAFVERAREATGCEVWHQDFLSLALPPARFHGIFANASLFHVPSAELPRVLGELHATLMPRGVLFASNPRGPDTEGYSEEGRYGAFHSLERWREHAIAAGFVELAHYYRPPGRPRAEQPWLATVWRRQP